MAGKGKPGPKKKKYLPFEQAKKYVQEQGIGTRAEYWRWHDLYKPKQVPKFPLRVYLDEWISWSDWLDSNNTFFGNKSKRWSMRSWEEHLQYGRSLGIATQDQWLMIEHPGDIYKRPDAHFKGYWTGWEYFLGVGKKKAANIVDGLQKIEENITEVLIFVVGSDVDQTVFVHHIKGIDTAKTWVREKKIPVIQAFKLDKGYDWQGYLKRWGTYYGDNEWRIPDLNECLFNIDLEWLR